MNKILRLAVGVAVLCLVVSSVQAGEDGAVGAELKALVERNFAMTQQEDSEGVLSTLHTKSPVYLVTSQILEGLFSLYDLEYELLSFKLLSEDGEYALARAKQKTTKIKGGDFKDNKIDSIYVFRKENGAWRLWQQCILETEYLQAATE